MFSAIDTDNNLQLSTQEVSKFLLGLINDSESDEVKALLNKDVMIFMKFIDIDKNGVLSKGEFLK